MKKIGTLSLIIAAITILFLIAGCSKSTDSAEGEGQITRFVIHPTLAKVASPGSPQQITLTKIFDAHCIDRANPECHSIVYVGVPDDGDWMSYAADHSPCTPFYAVINQDDVEYTFVGYIQRAFGDPGNPATPFVTGTFDSFDGTNYGAGTFEFFENELREDNNSTCP